MNEKPISKLDGMTAHLPACSQFGSRKNSIMMVSPGFVRLAGAPRGDQQLLQSPSSPNLTLNSARSATKKHRAKIPLHEIQLESCPSLIDEDETIYCTEDPLKEPIPQSF